MPSPNPPSELPAVQAEVVETKRPEVPPCPEMWVAMYFDMREPQGWESLVLDSRLRAEEYLARSGKHATATRLIRIPGEGESPSAPTKFPMCAVHSFVTTDVCGCARRDVPSAPTHAGEMPEWMTELIESAQIRADTFRSNGLGKWAGQLEDCIAKAKAHYDQPKPTGMTREVEELCEAAEGVMRVIEAGRDGAVVRFEAGGMGDRLAEAVAAVRAAGGGA